MFEHSFRGEVVGDFAMISPNKEEMCGSQGVYGRAEFFFWTDSVALR